WIEGGEETPLTAVRPTSGARRVPEEGRSAGLRAAGGRQLEAVSSGGRPSYCRARLLMRAVSSVTWVYVARRSLIRLVIFLTACMTVVWSLPPNDAPMRGSDSSVSSRQRYIAI